MNSPRLLNRSFVRKILRESMPMGHHEAGLREASLEADLGFGFAYYGLARILKPEQVLVIGSYRGFSVVCFALGLSDNGRGCVHFVDDSRADHFWKRPAAVRKHFSKFGVSERIEFYPIASAQYLR